MSRNWISLCSKVLERPFKVLVLARPRSINCIDLEIVLSHLSVLYGQERKKKLKKKEQHLRTTQRIVENLISQHPIPA